MIAATCLQNRIDETAAKLKPTSLIYPDLQRQAGNRDTAVTNRQVSIYGTI